MRKFLFIGVGGSGGKTLRFLKDVLTQRLAEAGYTGPLPDAWQFVQLDLPPNDDAAVGAVPAKLGAAYRGFAPSGVNYDHHLKQLAGRGSNDPALIEDLATWWPDPNEAPKQPWFGAGQYRAVGRLITLNRLAEIRTAIDNSVTAMDLDSATKNFDEIARAVGFPVGSALDESIAVVIGSMAGGTGSGALLDVCDLLRVIGQHGRPFLQMPFGVLYTAEIFAGAGDGAMPGIEPNSLAFASEVSGLLKQEISKPPVYLAASGAAAAITARGPALSFLVGRGNSNGLVLADDLAVFKSTAQAISAWVLDPGVQLQLQSSPVGNIDILGSTRSELSMHRHESEKQPMSSFGYAKFGVSRRRFHEYSAERLGRMVIDHLLRAHSTIVGDEVSASAAIEQVASPQRLNQFLRACKINERLGTDNDIIDAIREIANREMGASSGGTDIVSDLASHSSAVVESIVNSPMANSKNFSQADGNRMLQTNAADKAKFIIPTWDNAFREASSKWIESIKPTIIDGVVESMATLGLPVTVALVRDASSDLAAAISALQTEAAQWTQQSRDAFVNLPIDGSKAKAKAQNVLSRLRSMYTDPVKKFFLGSLEASLRTQAIEAIKTLNSSFMTPLAAALAEAERQLKDEWPMVKEWADGSTIPKTYRPDPNVVLLLDADDYPSTFDSLLSKTVGGSGAAALESAVRAVLTSGAEAGTGRNSRGTGPFIAWSGLASASGRAEITVDAAISAIRNRCWSWLKADPTTGIGQFITASLQDTLKGASKHDIDVFVSKFRTAFDRSAPLIAINPAAMMAVHGTDAPEYQRVMSQIPLEIDENDRAYQAVRDLLLEKGFDAAQLQGQFGKQGEDGADVGDIEMSTFMRAYHPMVFASLMTPIATAAQAAMGRGDMGFWRMRRSRPLSEFVPLSDRTQGFLARGWLVASILGQVRFDTETVFGHSFKAAKLATPEGSMSFITPGLGRLAVQPRDVFAAVLEAYPLAEVFAATGQVERLKPYERLLDLGSGTALQEWIATGEADAGVRSDFVGRDARLEHVIDKLRQAKDRLGEYDEEFDPNPSKWALPPRGFEVKGLIETAIDELLSTAGAEDLTENLSDDIQI